MKRVKKPTGKKPNEILVDEKYLRDQDIMEALEFQLGIPNVDLDEYLINPEIVLEIPENIARRYDLIAIDKKKNHLIVAMADPLNIFAIDDIKVFTKCEVKIVIAPKKIIQKNIDKFYRRESTEKMIKEFNTSYKNTYEEEIQEELLEITSAPIVKLINSIIEQAVDLGASDIHIEPYAEELRVRFRVDGDLHEIVKLSKAFLSAIVTRIKIMGQMNIAEKRLPQDGRAETRINGREIDIRISTIPTVYGEKVVLRLLDRSNFLFSKDELGFNEKNLQVFDKILRQPYGIFFSCWANWKRQNYHDLCHIKGTK